jgi:F0F1-type ATP synthase epsilon subunit
VVIAEGKADADYEAANSGKVSRDAKNKKLVSVQINGGVIELSNNKVIVLAS